MSEIPSTPPEGTPGIPPTPTPPPAGSGSPLDLSATAYAGPPATQDDKTMAMLAHLLGIVTWFVGPLVIWLIKKDQSPFVNDQGKEALNFQITVTIAGIVAGIVGALTMCIGFLLWPVVLIVNLIFCIMAAMKAKDGIAYRYPFALRLIK